MLLGSSILLLAIVILLRGVVSPLLAVMRVLAWVVGRLGVLRLLGREVAGGRRDEMISTTRKRMVNEADRPLVVHDGERCGGREEGRKSDGRCESTAGSDHLGEDGVRGIADAAANQQAAERTQSNDIGESSGDEPASR